MKESQEIVDYLEINFAEKSEHGSRLTLTKEGFSVSLKATINMVGEPCICVSFIPPNSHYED